MKAFLLPAIRHLMVVVGLTAFCFLANARTSFASGTTLFWDGDGLGVVGGGTGGWATTLARWATTSTASTYANWSNDAANPDSAVLGATAGTITFSIQGAVPSGYYVN